ncbi:hypothetical protein SAMN05216559_3779 [Halomicrobium zhouii]|uniref:Dolichyl-phosphate-mannose-protein mannosyltransferase n=1 Tax=Halomicrobium zhouii TaxID=767519 RepID=A0A1I6M549_9EURY|nr:hypothetical protein [Halomicrobium zhouii]SFS10662.1 hypothetical protein SAMN05216559_3779 [Halomicrobium zhouii]
MDVLGISPATNQMTSTSLPRSRRRRFTGVLAVGFLALTAAILAARSTPIDGYELSIYEATPPTFWAGVVLAALAAAIVALSAPPKSVPRRLGLLLGPMAIVSVVALPVLRGYYFFGAGDALSYLGWARLIADEQLNPVELLYPGIESTAIFVAQTTGITLRRSLLLIPPLLFAAFVVSVTLVVGRISTSRNGVVAGCFAALLVLPINNVHTYIVAYPTTAAIFFSPLVLYALFRYVTDEGSVARLGDRTLLTPFGVLLGIAGVAAILYHPQVGANVIAILFTVLGLQVLARASRRWVGSTAISAHRAIVAPAAVVGGFFLLWTPRFDRAQDTVGTLVTLLVSGADPGGTIEAKGTSLATLGGGIEELFLKMFLVSGVLSLVAGLVMLATLTRRLDDAPDRNALLTYLTVAFAPIFVLFLAFMVASLSVQQFRYLGFIMVFVTIFVAVAVADGIPFGLPIRSPTTRTTLAVGVFALLLVPQLAMVFSSPYIYQPSSQVTERTMEGYETSFEQRDPEVWHTGVRGGPRRYVDAYHGTTGSNTAADGTTFEGKDEMIPFGVWGNNMTEFYSRCRYVALEQSDYQREVGLYDGFRYSEAGFERMETDPRIHRVQSNGDFRLYVVAPEGSTCMR